MDYDIALIIILTAVATTLIVAPIAYALGWRAKDNRWRSALEYVQERGIGISRRSKEK